MPSTWRLKLLGNAEAPEDDRLSSDLKTLLKPARDIRVARPDLRLVVTVPADALEEDRDWVRQIANRIYAGSGDVAENVVDRQDEVFLGDASIGSRLLARWRPAWAGRAPTRGPSHPRPGVSQAWGGTKPWSGAIAVFLRCQAEKDLQVPFKRRQLLSVLQTHNVIREDRLFNPYRWRSSTCRVVAIRCDQADECGVDRLE
jgi:hypothetical protein